MSKVTVTLWLATNFQPSWTKEHIFTTDILVDYFGHSDGFIAVSATTLQLQWSPGGERHLCRHRPLLGPCATTLPTHAITLYIAVL